jgi:phosphohistidine phosphatase
MVVYFVRHGDAEPESLGVSDMERQLTGRGRQETVAMGQLLRRAGVAPGGIATSPAKRARQTAEILRKCLGLPADAVSELATPAPSMGDLQGLLGSEDAQPLMVVGHIPSLPRLISQLIGGGNTELAKSGVARVDADRAEPGAGRLVWLLGPEVVERV